MYFNTLKLVWISPVFAILKNRKVIFCQIVGWMGNAVMTSEYVKENRKIWVENLVEIIFIAILYLMYLLHLTILA